MGVRAAGSGFVSTVPTEPSEIAEQEAQPIATNVTAPISSSTRDSKPKLWPWIGGAGAVLLAAGGTMFAFGMSDKATVENAESSVRLSEIEAAHHRVPWLTGVGLSLGAVGLAGIGTAAILLLTERDAHADAPVTFDAGPTHVSLRGRF